VVVQLVSDEAITAGAMDDEDVALIRRLALGSVGVTPVRTPAATVALLSFANSTGRFIADPDVAALEQLAAAAGTALARLGY
jgi:GAF domain-containing protein